MDLVDRIIFLVIGGCIGFVLGYIVAKLQTIQSEVDEVLVIEKGRSDLSNDSATNEGLAKPAFLGQVMLATVLIVVVFAAFSSQRASNQVENNQDSIQRVTMCNQRFLGQLLYAVNERTTFTAEQARANIELQRAQSKFLSILLVQPPKGDSQKVEALRAYFNNLTSYIDVNSNAARKVEENPYPTIKEFKDCADRAVGRKTR